MDPTEASYRYCARVSRREARTFHWAFLFLPRAKRRGLHATYTYSRRLDDAVDATEERDVEPEAARTELARLEGLLSEDPAEDPLTPALQDVIRRFSIPLQPFHELIEGMRTDLVQRRYETFDDLYRYCYRAASTVGLICVRIFGYRGDEALRPAEELGIAMQLVNILRDVAEDLGRDRIYLPQEDLERFGLREDDLRRGRTDERVRALLRFEAERARDYFARSEALLPLVEPDARYCPMLLKRLYSRLLDRIEAANWEVLEQRVRLPRREKLALAIATWHACRPGRAARKALLRS